MTKLATGFPGKPINGVPPMMPMATGRPGLIAIRHSTSLPMLFDGGLDVILLAGGNATAGEDQIMDAGHFLQTLRQCRAIVAQDAEIADLTAEPRQQRHQHEAVGVKQLR